MNNVTMNQTIRRITKIFYFFGIWQSKEESTFRKTGRKFIYMSSYILFQIFLVSCATLSKSENELIFLIAVEIMISVITIKLYYLLWEQDNVLAFVNDPIVDHLTADPDILMKLNTKIENFMNFVHSYLTMIGMSFTFYIISSLPIWPTERKLPLLIPYFNFIGKYSEIIYWIEYVYVVSGLICGFTCTLMNVIIWYIMFNYSVEYQVLGKQLRNLGVNKINKTDSRWFNNPQIATRKLFHQNCVDLIKSHRNIFRYNNFDSGRVTKNNTFCWPIKMSLLCSIVSSKNDSLSYVGA